MSKISPLDTLFITVSQRGTSRLMTRLTGITSFCDIVAYMRHQLPDLTGMTTIAVRNSTEGWSATRSVVVR